MEPQDEITIDPAIQGGLAVIAGTRMPVRVVLGALASGMSREETCREYTLTKEQIAAALNYALTVLPKQPDPPQEPLMPPTDCIRIQNLTFYGYHGVDAEERRLGGKFSLDVEMYLDLRPAGESDDLTRTVDYKAVYELVRAVHDGKHFLLLEALAEAVAAAILREFAVDEVLLRVRKHSVPLQGLIDYTEVEIRRARE